MSVCQSMVNLKALTGNRWKFATVALIVALVIVSFVALYKPQVGASAQPNFLNVSIDGPSKLSPQQVGAYTASVNNSYSGKLEYVWSVSPSDNKTVLVSNGDKCNLTFVVATEEPYMLSVTAIDLVVGNQGTKDMIVRDPFAQPNLYLGVYGMPYNYKVESDGLGNYHAVNGQTGQITSSSTSASTVFQSTVQSNTLVYVAAGNYGFPGAIGFEITGVQNYTLTGSTGAVLTATYGSKEELIKVTNSTHILIDKLSFQGQGQQGAVDEGTDAITAYAYTGLVVDITVSNSVFNNFGGDAYVSLFGVVGQRIINNYFSNCFGDAVNIGGGGGSPGSSDAIVSGNILKTGAKEGIHISTGSSGSIVSGNTISGFVSGIGFYDSSNNNVYGNKISGSTYGILDHYGTNENNTISYNQISGADYGIEMGYHPNSIQIQGNRVDDFFTGITVFGAANNVMVQNNELNSSRVGVGYGIYLPSITSGTITGNKVSIPIYVSGGLTYGIAVTGGPTGGQIIGHALVSGNTLTGGRYGVYMDAYNITVIGNKYIDCTTGTGYTPAYSGGEGGYVADNDGDLSGWYIGSPSNPANETYTVNTYPFKVNILINSPGSVSRIDYNDTLGNIKSITGSSLLIAGEWIPLDSGWGVVFTYSSQPSWYWERPK